MERALDLASALRDERAKTSIFVIDKTEQEFNFHHRGVLHNEQMLQTEIPCATLVSCSKNGLATTAVMPRDRHHPLPGIVDSSPNNLTLEKEFMTKKGFSENYWTTDSAKINEMKETYFLLHKVSLPFVAVRKPMRGSSYTSQNLNLEFGHVNGIKKIKDGHPFLLTAAATGEVIAFKYNTWWDGALMMRDRRASEAVTLNKDDDTGGFKVIFKDSEANRVTSDGIVYVGADASKTWLQKNIQRIPKICGESFQNVGLDDEFGKELCETTEYIYTEKHADNESMLIMKKNPILRGKVCEDVLYVELICSKIGNRSRQLIGKGGVADALAAALNVSKLLLSTLFLPSTLYATDDIGFQFVKYHTLTKASHRRFPAPSPQSKIMRTR